MLTGLSAGIAWALETVILGIALGMTPFVSSAEAIVLAPFISTFLHDSLSALYMLIYNFIRGNAKGLIAVFKSDSFKWLITASAIGGPIGMTGYVLAVSYMGASIGAVASAVYPAVGTLLAFLFLKERVRWYQWIFLITALLGVYGLSYSPSVSIENFWLGILGTFMCAFGWGIEAVILAKCLKAPDIKNEYALCIRQLTSAVIYGAVILPIISGWQLVGSLFSRDSITVIPVIAAAALCATASYLLYYRAISGLGASRAMALNITYTAWAIVFTVIIAKDMSVINPQTLICAAVVVICGILAATDIQALIGKNKKLR